MEKRGSRQKPHQLDKSGTLVILQNVETSKLLRMAFEGQENHVREKMPEEVLWHAQFSVEKRRASAGSTQELWERGIGSPQGVQGLQV